MARWKLAPCALATLLLGAAAQSAVNPPRPGAVPLIPRAALFGNPERTLPRISPDGRFIAFLAPRNGMLNVWIAPRENLSAARALTNSQRAPIVRFEWARNGTHIVFPQDNDGDENFRFYSVDVRSGKVLELMRAEGPARVRVDLVRASSRFPDEVAMSSNARDPRFPDLFRVNVVTGEQRLVALNEGMEGIEISDDLSTVAGTRPNEDTSIDLIVSRNGQRRSIAKFDPVDSRLTRALGVSANGDTVFYLSSKGRNTAALFEIPASGGTAKLLAADARADVTNMIEDQETGRPLAYHSEYQRPVWRPIGKSLQPSLALLRAAGFGVVNVTGRTADDRMWTVETAGDRDPGHSYLLDRRSGKLTKLFAARPALEGAPLVEMRPMVIRARDGMDMVGYYVLPQGSDRKQAGRPDKPLPLVFYIHGGPWNRDRFGWSQFLQLFANRGYAAMVVNFRASTGFGKALTNAGDREWGRRMHEDLIDAVDWAVRGGIADPKRIAPLGASYGGYATLAAMTLSPERFACGVDAYGPANLVTLLDSLPKYWSAGLAQMYKSVGDPRTEEGRALLTSASPIHRADRIRSPLLIAQGGNDVRVPPRESQQMVDAMKRNRVPVTYLYFPDEGHSFLKPDNRGSFWAITENFLATCLGGRSEPIDPGQIARSTLRVPDGVSAVPGLAAALTPERMKLDSR